MEYSTVSLKHDLRYGGCSLFKRGCLSPGYAKVSYLSPVFVLVGGCLLSRHRRLCSRDSDCRGRPLYGLEYVLQGSEEGDVCYALIMKNCSLL